ncbi:MAG TPA: type II toxin-antitoxin system VapC family toxin [Candidatus Acidoferrum sp.]|nr:type II toxin-antitoxin system VapC family toxin [Candidatus Acidoferrum sp.]
MKVYADPSFIVSLYSPDANSAAAAHTMQATFAQPFVTTFGELEVVNAMGLRVFRKEVSPVQAQSSLLEFEKDLRDGVFQLRELTDPILDRARQLSRQTTAKLDTRTADLLHVAAALELSVDCLYTFDLHQRKLAQSLRLKLN